MWAVSAISRSCRSIPWRVHRRWAGADSCTGDEMSTVAGRGGLGRGEERPASPESEPGGGWSPSVGPVPPESDSESDSGGSPAASVEDAQCGSGREDGNRALLVTPRRASLERSEPRLVPPGIRAETPESLGAKLGSTTPSLWNLTVLVGLGGVAGERIPRKGWAGRVLAVVPGRKPLGHSEAPGVAAEGRALDPGLTQVADGLWSFRSAETVPGGGDAPMGIPGSNSPGIGGSTGVKIPELPTPHGWKHLGSAATMAARTTGAIFPGWVFATSSH